MSSLTARKRAYRRRQRCGRIVLKVEVDENALAAALIESGRVSEAAGLNRADLERELGAMLGDWVHHWAPIRR